MNEPLVSVILCFYNEENCIENAVQSILNQTYKHVELILIDDNSTDRSLELVNKFEDDRISVFIKDKSMGKGLAQSRNLGVTKAQGDYIVFQDADDQCHEDRIKEKVRYIQKNGDAIVGSWLWWEKNGKTSLKKFPIENKDIRKGLNRTFNRNVIAGQVLLYPKWVLEKYPYDLKFKYMQDYDQLFRVAENEDVVFTNIPIPLYTYVISNKGVKAKKDWPLYNYFVRRCRTLRKKGLQEPKDINSFLMVLNQNWIEMLRWKIFHFALRLKIEYLE